jgi:hypothetical protein
MADCFHDPIGVLGIENASAEHEVRFLQLLSAVVLLTSGVITLIRPLRKMMTDLHIAWMIVLDLAAVYLFLVSGGGSGP